MYYPPLPPLKMEIKRLPRMNEGQLKQARKLIQAKCCNYDNGHCLALDDGIDDRCPQWHTYSLLCKWFHKAVLPNNPALHEKLIDLSATHKRCAICNRFFLGFGLYTFQLLILINPLCIFISLCRTSRKCRLFPVPFCNLQTLFQFFQIVFLAKFLICFILFL